MPSVTRHRGFTLAELLVVIAIIGCLVLLIASALAGALGTADQVACATNLRALALAVRAYTTSHEGWLPTAEPPKLEFPDARYWFLNPDLLTTLDVPLMDGPDGEVLGPPRADTVLICPSHDTPCAARDGASQPYGLSYGMNGTLGLAGRPDHTVQRHVTEFAATDQTMLLADAWGRAHAPGVVLYRGCVADHWAFRHNGRANVVFLDGHVEALKEEEVPMGMWNRNAPFWGTPRH